MINIFLLAGQSNMVGAATKAVLPRKFRGPYPNVRLFENCEWHSLLWRTTFGPELGFIHTLKSYFPDEKIVLCKVAFGGANLYYDWNPDGISKGPEDIYRGPLYPRLMDSVVQVKTQLKAEGVQYTIAAMLWMQGERDSVFKFMAQVHSERLRAFIGSVRRDTDVLELPVLLGEISPRKYNIQKEEYTHTFWKTVQSAQTKVANDDPMVVMIPTQDLPQSDNLHFDTGGQIELGKRFAAAYLSLLKSKH